MRRCAPLIAAIALLASCSGPAAIRVPATELDSLIAFSNPAMCEMTPETAALVAGLFRNDPDTQGDSWIQPGAVPAHLRDQLGPITRQKYDGWWTIRTAVRAKLWELPLIAIEQVFPEGGDPGGITFEFQAPVETVERAARERGFIAEAGKAVPMSPPDALSYEIDLYPAPRDRSRSLLGCRYS